MKNESAHLEWLRRNAPGIAGIASIAAFVAVRLAGRAISDALLVAGIMLVFATFLIKLRQWFGVRIAAAVVGTLSFLLFLALHYDWV
ncbi:hypothetical protein G5B40_16405 [Pikeienuella piscinae]|uniref:Uncharacterized protein n=1 Tax=Pikeienuella piscinae TaxID=2748098 RepID=A0A7L5C4M8_9RHOB|nr:hypothetical protein [Pikeienuella piscinae]QIE56879.1 hypothetical protein G5B40_16405 [Pikeienuella piscinae]